MTPADKPDAPWRLTRGVVMASLRAGEEVGKPLREPAHQTPRYPNGIKNSDLGRKDQIIQRETALWWFHLNLEPYDLSKAGPYFGFAESASDGRRQNIAGFDRGSFAPTPVQAGAVLQLEFAGALMDEMIDGLAAARPGNWMWKRAPIQPGSATPETTAEVLAALVPVLAALTSELRKLTFPPAHGGMGHNSSGADIPLTEQERAEIIAELMEAQKTAEAGQDDAPSKVRIIWTKNSPKLVELGLWALRVVGVVAGGAASCYIAEYLPAPHFIIHSLFLQADHLIRLLGSL